MEDSSKITFRRYIGDYDGDSKPVKLKKFEEYYWDMDKVAWDYNKYSQEKLWENFVKTWNIDMINVNELTKRPLSNKTPYERAIDAMTQYSEDHHKKDLEVNRMPCNYFDGNKVNYSSEYFDRLVDEKVSKKIHNMFDIDRIVYNPPATIVFWKDGTKTVVKCDPSEKFSKYHGFCAAVAKRLYLTSSQINRIVKGGIEQIPVEEEENDGGIVGIMVKPGKKPVNVEIKTSKKTTKGRK